jgi:hypothetical protein
MPRRAAALLVIFTVAAADADEPDMDIASMMGGLGDMGGMGGMDMESMMGGIQQAGEGGGMGGGPPPPPITGAAEDVSYIQCAVCKQLVKRSVFVTKSLRDSLKTTKLAEEKILETLVGDPGFGLPNAPSSASGGVCNVDSKDGEWLHAFDMQENQAERTITLKKMNVPGVCGVECKTAALACTEALGVFDSPLAEALFKNSMSSKELELEACGAPGHEGWASSLAGSCSKPTPLTPQNRQPLGAFEPKPKEASPPLSKPKKKGKGKKGKGKKAAKATNKAEL